MHCTYSYTCLPAIDRPAVAQHSFITSLQLESNVCFCLPTYMYMYMIYKMARARACVCVCVCSLQGEGSGNETCVFFIECACTIIIHVRYI